MSFRDRFFTPPVARAVTSPSAILATGAGAAVGILAFGAPLAAVALGLGAYGVRVLAAVPRTPTRTSVDVRRLAEPWRSLMDSVLDARRRYDVAVHAVRPGPLRERLDDVRGRLDDAVEQAGAIATSGDALSGARAQIDLAALRSERSTTEAGPSTQRRDQTIGAIDAQIASAERLDGTIGDTYDRLRLLDARLDETVTRTVELTATQVEAVDVSGLGSEVDGIVSDLESLRQAVEEADGSAGTGATP